MNTRKDLDLNPFVAKSVAELLALHDESFVRCAYWTLLGREADAGGLVHYLERARTGEPKADILMSLCRSDEFKARTVRLPGIQELLDRLEAEPVVKQRRKLTPQRREQILRLMSLEGSAFVAASYECVLGRGADPEGLAFYGQLLARTKDKRQIIQRMLTSDEFSHSNEDAQDIASLLGITLGKGGFGKRLREMFGIAGGGGKPGAADADEVQADIATLKANISLREELAGSAKSTQSAAASAEAIRTALRRFPPLGSRLKAGERQHAAVTIVSKNYFAQAATLADTYLRQHPGHDFLIVLVDVADSSIPETLPSGAKVIELVDIDIPDLSRFIYRYTIMELNTAVKPFALGTLFERGGYETLLYIDPDIYVFERFDAIYDALETSSVVLIPHTRKPYFDGKFPSDTSVLTSGTYNLGFIGLKRGTTSRDLLDWWMGKLYFDCIVDIPNGLFVDQKWIDLVPGFFPDHKIVYHPGYNAAYWNLHERPLELRDGRWHVGGEPLVFFHYSGYNPFNPAKLSKHQDRHLLIEGSLLRRLTDEYAAALFERGFEKSSGWDYAFGTLRNGVRIPLDLVREVMQWSGRYRIPTPCPILQPDDFCRFLMGKGAIPGRPKAVHVLHFLLKIRPDVSNAFPGAIDDSSHAGFRLWIQSSGLKEYLLEDLLPFEAPYHVHDLIAEAFHLTRVQSTADDEDRVADALASDAAFLEYIDWVRTDGAQLGLAESHAAALEKARPDVLRILHAYYLRADLQKEFSQLYTDDQINRYLNWLRWNRADLDISDEAITLFGEFTKANRRQIELSRILYLHQGAVRKTPLNLFDIERRLQEVGSSIAKDEVLDWLLKDWPIPATQHWLAYKAERPGVDLGDALATTFGSKFKKVHEFRKHLQEEEAERGLAVNLAGDLEAPTGMGESVRSMRALLQGQADTQLGTVTLPHPLSAGAGLPERSDLFGWPRAQAAISILVANADSVERATAFVPAAFAGAKRVGFWVWETEELPLHLARNCVHFDEIWTPSEFSAEAIRKHATKPVKVLPHTLDFQAIDKARADRAGLGLPAEGVLFGYMFDPLSGMERKNVKGLIAAFTKAFSKSDDAYLVLKVNGKARGDFEFERLLAGLRSERVLLLEQTMTRDRTFEFLATLDAYVSLHRAEGFGLTCAEAMALGKPVVASNYSGNLEFMTESNSLLVPTERIVTDRAYGPYPPGTVWGNPDVDAAAAALRQLLDASRRGQLGERARKSIRETLGLAALGPRLAALLGQEKNIANRATEPENV